MHTDKFKANIKNDYIEIENISDRLIDNCLVNIRNIFSTDIIHEITTFAPGEIKTFKYTGKNFTDQYSNEKICVRVYTNSRLIYKKDFNDKTKCYVVFSNKQYEELVEQLIIGLDRYSNVDILHYTIDYKSRLAYQHLTNIEFTINGDSTDKHDILFAKPSIFLDVLNRGYQSAVFLDADIQVKSNIDSLFNYISEIEDGPIFQKGAWDYTMIHGQYIPGPELIKILNLQPEQKAPQGITNILIFNQNNKELFKEWEEVCFSKEVNKIKSTEFLHDELILNCLLWKNGIKPKHYWFATNVLSKRDVQFFYDYNPDISENLTDMNQHGLGHVFQSFIPYDKETICGFHCVKDIKVASEINDLIYKKEGSGSFEKDTIDFYKDLKLTENRLKPDLDKTSIVNHYTNGAYIELRGNIEKEFNVKFLDGKGSLVYSNKIKTGMWAALSRKYFDEYTCEVQQSWDDQIVYKAKYNAEGKRVYIALDSSSLGDTFAWMPYAEEFRKKHNCHVILSTFMNDLFVDQYPEIEFVKPGTNVDNLYAMYTIGWYYDEDGEPDKSRNPQDFRSIPLQQTASDILGLEYKEVRPRIKVPNVAKKKKVGIGFHSTSQAKYWNNPTGWQEVTDYLISQGYEVVIYSKEGDDFMGNKFPKGATKFPNGPLKDVIEDMASCEYFIGIGSGLSWLAWAVGVHVVLISGFSEEYSEPVTNVTRIINKNVCHGCFNTHRLDAGDWNWCPKHKNTDRMFECTKEITGSEVIKAIKDKLGKPKVAFITAIYGGYEATCKQYEPQSISADFICFTDNQNISPNGWIIDTNPYHDTNPSDLDKPELVNSMKNNRHTFNIAKYYKQAWKNIPRLKEYDVVIWLDGTIEVTNKDAAMIMYVKVKQYGIAGWNHELRFGKLEPEVLASIGLDSNGGRYTSNYYMGQDQPFQDVTAQYFKYIEDGYNEEYWKNIERKEGKGDFRHFGVWLTCFIGFDTRSKEVSDFMDNWYTQTLRFTTQDQIGFPKTVQETGLIPYTYPDEQVAGINPHVRTDFYYRHHHGI
jgi:autotransporter strand-loop-strand O-heptosyltransferase